MASGLPPIHSILIIAGRPKVCLNHDPDEICECVGGFPAENLSGFRRVTEEDIHFAWSDELWVGHDVVLVVESHMAECKVAELSHGVSFTGGKNEVIRGVMLEHHPHAFNKIAGVPPVASGVEVP